MDHLRKFMALKATDRLLLTETAFLLGLTVVMLHLLPFPWVRHLLIGQGPASDSQLPDHVASQIVRMVKTASRYVYAASCLPQAIVTRLLLNRRGYAATLRIGVAMNGSRQLVAHAWVERDGQILIGGSDSHRRYATLPPLEKESP